jgi:uncharacterized protein (TIGR02246 family)
MQGSYVEGHTEDWYAIQELLARYIACVDSADASGVASLFLPDGKLVSQVMGKTCVGRKAIAEYIASLRQSWTSIRIHLALPHVTIRDTTARSWAYFSVLGGNGPDHWGLYTDELLRKAGRWQFLSREISLTGASPGSERMQHR